MKELTEQERAMLDDVFGYHAPEPEQVQDYAALRAGAKEFARIVLQHAPKCADQSVRKPTSL